MDQNLTVLFCIHNYINLTSCPTSLAETPQEGSDTALSPGLCWILFLLLKDKTFRCCPSDMFFGLPLLFLCFFELSSLQFTNCTMSSLQLINPRESPCWCKNGIFSLSHCVIFGIFRDPTTEKEPNHVFLLITNRQILCLLWRHNTGSSLEFGGCFMLEWLVGHC